MKVVTNAITTMMAKISSFITYKTHPKNNEEERKGLKELHFNYFFYSSMCKVWHLLSHRMMLILRTIWSKLIENVTGTLQCRCNGRAGMNWSRYQP
jgi:hypothetical protein